MKNQQLLYLLNGRGSSSISTGPTGSQVTGQTLGLVFTCYLLFSFLPLPKLRRPSRRFSALFCLGLSSTATHTRLTTSIMNLSDGRQTMADRKSHTHTHTGWRKMNQVMLTSNSSEDRVAACFCAVNVLAVFRHDSEHTSFLRNPGCQYQTLCLIAMETVKCEIKLFHAVKLEAEFEAKDNSVCVCVLELITVRGWKSELNHIKWLQKLKIPWGELVDLWLRLGFWFMQWFGVRPCKELLHLLRQN